MPKTHKKNSREKINNKYKVLLIIIIILAILFIININNKEKKYNVYNSQTQIILNNENITNDLKDKVFLVDGKIYLSFEDIKKFFDESIYKEDSSNTLITIGDNKVVAVKENSNIILVNGSSIQENSVLINKEDKDYLSISYLASIYNYDINYITKTNIVVLDSLNKKSEKAMIKKKAKLKENCKLFAKTITTILKEEEIYVVSEDKKFVKVRTIDGLIGYIKTNQIENKRLEREDFVIKNNNISNEDIREIDITNNDISTFEKREKLVNNILQESVKNGYLNIKIINLSNNNFEFERFKKESVPVLLECGIGVNF